MQKSNIHAINDILLKQHTVLIIFLVFSINNLYSQSPSFRNFNVHNGLASSEVYDVIQDSKGYMWFATENGVSFYNGIVFKTLSTMDGLADNVIINVQEDTKGRIWFIPLSGLPSYYFLGEIHQIALYEKYGYSKVGSFVEDKEGVLWFSAVEGIIKVFNDGNAIYEPIKISYKGEFIVSLKDKNDNAFFWGNMRKNGIICYDKIKNEYKNSRYGNGNLYFNNNHSGFFKRSIELCQSFLEITDTCVYINDCVQKEMMNYISNYSNGNSDNIVFIKENSEKGYWVGTYNDGLYLFVSNKKVYHYLRGMTVSNVVSDSENNIWITTIGNGVFLLTNKNIIVYTKENSQLAENKITAIAGNGKNKIFIGFSRPIINVLENDTIVKYIIDNTMPGNNRIVSLYWHKDSSLYIVLDQIIKKLKKDQIYSFKKKYDDLYQYHTLKCIAPHRSDEGVYVGSHTSLLSISDRINVDIGKKYDILGLRIGAIYEDEDSSMWIGTSTGLLHIKNGQKIYYRDSLFSLSKRITDIKPLGKGLLCIATSGGGVVFHGKRKTYALTIQNGLLSNNCRSVFVENDSTCWIATDNGIAKINLSYFANEIKTIKYYTEADGLSSNETVGVYKYKDTVWVATSNGLTKFLDVDYSVSRFSIPTYITAITINGSDTILKDNYNLNDYQNNIVIDFIGLSYKNIGNVTYRYKISGLKDYWNYTSNPRVQYPSLPPGGHYTFQVSSKNKIGQWSQPAFVSFHIRPVFWKTWWFQAIVLLLFLLIAFFTVYFFFLQLKRKKEKVEYSKKLTELQLTALKAQMNPHFIFNSINSIRLFIFKSNLKDADAYLTTFSLLIRNVLENSTNNLISIQKEINTIELYLKLEALRFAHKINYSINVDPDIDLNNSFIPPMIIQPFIENALWHGLMHKKSEGNLLVELKNENEYVCCIVEDDGVGRKKSQEYKSINNAKKKSLGMSVTKERLEILNQDKKKTAGVDIIDKEDDKGIAMGTKVIINIPIDTRF